jgi:hypothetical protein
MPRRPLARAGVELSGRLTAIQLARAQLFDVDVDRKKRIDDAIDYFGAGTSPSLGRMSGDSSRRIATSPQTLKMGTGPRRFARDTRASSPMNLALPTVDI